MLTYLIMYGVLCSWSCTSVVPALPWYRVRVLQWAQVGQAAPSTDLTTLKLVNIEDASSNFSKVSFNIRSQDSVPILCVSSTPPVSQLWVSQLANAQSWGAHYRLGSFTDTRRVTFACTSMGISKATFQPTSAHANQFSPSNQLGWDVSYQKKASFWQLGLILNLASTRGCVGFEYL